MPTVSRSLLIMILHTESASSTSEKKICEGTSKIAGLRPPLITHIRHLGEVKGRKGIKKGERDAWLFSVGVSSLYVSEKLRRQDVVVSAEDITDGCVDAREGYPKLRSQFSLLLYSAETQISFWSFFHHTPISFPRVSIFILAS